MNNKIDTEDNTSVNNYVTFRGCEVLWPPDCPDNMLEFAIREVNAYSKDYPVETNGSEVK